MHEVSTLLPLKIISFAQVAANLLLAARVLFHLGKLCIDGNAECHLISVFSLSVLAIFVGYLTASFVHASHLVLGF